MRLRFILVLSALVALFAAGGCDKSDGTTGSEMCVSPRVMRPRSDPIEFIGVSVTQQVTPEQFMSFASQLFGTEAAAGRGFTDHELRPGLSVTTAPDARTADQLVIELKLVPSDRSGGREPRTILRAPVGTQYAKIYMDAVDVALTMANEKYAHDPSDTDPWHLEYRTISVNGGALEMRVDWRDGHATMTLKTENPRTSLHAGEVNSPAFTGDPYETLAGTVNFRVGRDEFGFFSTRAYGITSGRAQNFNDFMLVPHDWLRITVTPRLTDEVVDVGFDVVTRDGRRIPLAKAPASFLAGEQFQQTVYRMMDDMKAQEAATPGSSLPFETSFYYDDPEGGGVVSVIVQGNAGDFNIAYAVESPTHRLRDVEYIPYTRNLVIPDHLEPPPTSCADIGSTTSLRGRFAMKFDASSTVRNSTDLDGPLRGNVWGDVYRASDVTITGPNAGAVAVASFHFENVDMTAGASPMEYELDTDIPAGDYQILGFMDIDGNSNPSDNGPDLHDPVTLPIGSYKLECARQPVTVEFALLLPPGR